MAAAKNPRNKLVSFRVSDNEFERLKEMTEIQGDQSVSDYARKQVFDTREPVNNNQELAIRLAGIEDQMAGISIMIAELIGRSAKRSIKPVEEQLANGGVHH